MSHAQAENKQHRRDMVRLRAEQAHIEAEDKFKKECQTLLQKVRQMQCRLREEQMQEDARVQAMFRQVNRVLRDCSRKRERRSSSLCPQSGWASEVEGYSSDTLHIRAPSIQRLVTLGMNDPDFALSSLDAIGLTSSGLSTAQRRQSYAAPMTSSYQMPATSELHDMLKSLRTEGGDKEAEANDSMTRQSLHSAMKENQTVDSPEAKPRDSPIHLQSITHITNNGLSTEGGREFSLTARNDSHQNSDRHADFSQHEAVLQREKNNEERYIPASSKPEMVNLNTGDAESYLNQPIVGPTTAHERSECVSAAQQDKGKLPDEDISSDDTECEVSFGNHEQDRSLHEMDLKKQGIEVESHSKTVERPHTIIDDNTPEKTKNSHQSPSQQSVKNSEIKPMSAEQAALRTATSPKAAVLQSTNQGAEQGKTAQKGKSSANRTESEVSSLSMEQPPLNETATQVPPQEQVPRADETGEKTPSKAEKTSRNMKEKEFNETKQSTRQDHEEYAFKTSDDDFSLDANAGELPFTLTSAFANRHVDAGTESSSSGDSLENALRQAVEERHAGKRKKEAPVKAAGPVKVPSNESSSSSEDSEKRPTATAKPNTAAASQQGQSAAQAPKTPFTSHGRLVGPGRSTAPEEPQSDLDVTGPSIDDDDDEFYA